MGSAWQDGRGRWALRFAVAFTVCSPLSAVDFTKLDRFWTFTPDGTAQPSAVAVGVEPFSELPSGSPCCTGVYRWSGSLNAALSDNSVPAIFFPAIGGQYEVLINGVPRYGSNRDSSVGPLVPLSITDLVDNAVIEIRLSASRVVFAGLWRDAPIFGSSIALLRLRDQHLLNRKTLPTAAASILAILGLLLLSVYCTNRTEFREYGVLAFSALSWSLFYLSLSGILRDIYFPGFSVLHFPIRSVAGIGLFLQVAINSSLPWRAVRTLVGLQIGIVCAELALGASQHPNPQVTLWLFSAMLLFIPLASTHPREQSTLSKVIVVLSWWAALGQILNGIKVAMELQNIRHDVPYFMFAFYFPLLLTTAVKYAVDFVSLHRREILTLRELEATREFTLTASRVAHDIQAPISALSVLAGTEGASERARGEVLRRALHRIQQIVRDLTEPVPSSALQVRDLDNACREVVEEAQLRFRHLRNVAIRFESSEASAGTLRTTRLALQRALTNVINNAVEAIESEGTVTVYLKASSRAVELEVKDTGKGIPSDVITHLGSCGATYGKLGGRGLGLFSMKQLAEEAGGSLKIRSKIGHGTAVTVTIPVVPS